MSSKTLTGTYTAGYTLSAGYSALTIAANGRVSGAGGAAGADYTGQIGKGGDGGLGQAGVTLDAVVSVSNSGTLAGGAGGVGGYGGRLGGYGGTGAGGSAGVTFAATGTFTNIAGAVTGGAGGAGGAAFPSHTPSVAGDGGAGGAGVALAGAGQVVILAGAITGGAGGAGGQGYQYRKEDAGNGVGGAGGAGVSINGVGSISNAGQLIGGVGGAKEGVGGSAAILAAGGSIDNSGSLLGGAGGVGAHGDYPMAGGVGGAALVLGAAGTVSNTGLITGGAGGLGGFGGYLYIAGQNGGSGGAGAKLSGGFLSNLGTVAGGAGGKGESADSGGGVGGTGGVGVVFSVSGQIQNDGSLQGGAGGAGGWAYYVRPADGGVGGAGASLSGSAGLVNDGQVAGGQGGAGGAYDYGGVSGTGGDGGAGGAGVILTGTGTVKNAGSVLGGAGGVGGYGKTALGATGATGDGVVLTGTGTVINGSASGTTALISGDVAVYAGAGGAATVTNFGTLAGSSGVSVAFKNKADRLIAAAGSTFVGAVTGGGGALELAGGTGTISGLGGSGAVSGSEAIAFSGFGQYVIDKGSSWSLSGTNVLGANQQVANYGTLYGALTLGSSTDHLVLGAGSVTGRVNGGGGTLRLAGGYGFLNIGAGKYSGVAGDISAYFTGFATYVIGAGGRWQAPGMSLAQDQKLVCEAKLQSYGYTANTGLIEAGLGGQIQLIGTVVNSGTIEALPSSVVRLTAATVTGGALVTGGTGRILFAGGGNELGGAASPPTLNGQFAVTNGSTLMLAGSITGTGELTLYGSTYETILTIANTGATLSGGRLYLSNSLHNLVVGQSAGATLTNVSDHIFGAGFIGKGTLILINGAAGSIQSFGSAGLTIDTGANTIINVGVIEANHAPLTIASAMSNSGLLEAAGATLTLAGAVNGTGSLVILAGGSIVAQAALNESVKFVGGTGSLTLAQSRGYGGTISGFSRLGGTKLDLRDIGFVSKTEASFSGNASGGVLTVSDGAHTARIALAGDYTHSTFVAASDLHGGVVITDPQTLSQASPAPFAAAMASMGAGAPGPTSGQAAGSLASPTPPMLIEPRASAG